MAKMPNSIMVITDKAGQPLAIHADGNRIKREDVATVYTEVLQ